MKKIAAIFLLSIYLISSIGLLVGKHFCGGKLSAITFYTTTDEKDCCGENEQSSNCCHDEKTFLQLKNDFVKTNSTSISPSQKIFSVDVLLYAEVFLNKKNSVVSSSDYFLPPLKRLPQPICIQHSCWLI